MPGSVDDDDTPNLNAIWATADNDTLRRTSASDPTDIQATPFSCQNLRSAGRLETHLQARSASQPQKPGVFGRRRSVIIQLAPCRRKAEGGIAEIVPGQNFSANDHGLPLAI